FHIRVKPAETFFHRHAERLAALERRLGEHVRDGDDPGFDAEVLGRFEKIPARAAAASAHADDAGVEGRFILRVQDGREIHGRRRRRGREGGVLEELPARNRRRFELGVWFHGRVLSIGIRWNPFCRILIAALRQSNTYSRDICVMLQSFSTPLIQYFVISSADGTASGRTRRKPTVFSSVKYHLPLGSCGSVIF